MIWLRSMVFLLLQALLTVVFALAGLVAAPFPLKVRYRIVTGWNRCVVWLARWVCGIRYRIEGLENLPQQPSVVMAKHQSAWETIALPVLLPPMAMVIKRELLRIPFFGWGMAMLAPIAIDRSEGRAALRQLTEQGRKRLAEGMWVLIFPEGTRVAVGESGKYNIGGAWLAVHAGAQVVPVAQNAGRLWPRNAWLKRPGLITVRIGPPIDTAGKRPDAVSEEVRAWIEDAMRHLP